MSEIPVSVKIVEDELFVTWMETVARLNGCETEWEVKKFCDTFFDGCRFTRLNNYPIHVSVLSDWMNILKKHTDLYMILPFLTRGMQGKILEFCLRNPDYVAAKFIGFGLLCSKRKICPICLKEDIKQYGRKVIHVPHQQSDTCWKHGVKLFDENDKMLQIENSMQQQIDTAKFIYDLYENPIITCYEQTAKVWNNAVKARGLTVKQVPGLAAKDGYVEERAARYMVDKMYTIIKVKPVVFGLFTWLYGTADNFRREMKSDVTMFEIYSEYELLEKQDIIGKYRCNICGNAFYMHPEAVKRGAPCPFCSKSMTNEQIQQRYLKKYCNNEYEIIDKNKMQHKLCGTVYEANLSERLWKNDIKCKICNSQVMRWQQQIDPTMTEYKIIREKTKGVVEIAHVPYNHNFTISLCNLSHTNMYCRICDSLKRKRKMKREGEENIDRVGQKRVLISYQGNQNVSAQYEDGKTYKMTYQCFSSGMIPVSRLRVNHVGEKGINKQGEELEIIKYRILQDLDVRFDDGTVVEHVTYNMFERGTITRGKRRISKKEQCMGEESTNRWGEHMKIVGYRACRDLDVQFDDGTIVTTSYDKFKRKTVKHNG